LLVNDHSLKGAGVLPAWLTGKTSDVAGLVVAPALLALVVRARGGAAVVACHVAVGLGFSLLKTVPAAAEAWSRALSWVVPSRLWCDPTDLVALPALGLSWRLFRRAGCPSPAERERGRHFVAAALGLFGCVATSRAGRPPVIVGGDVVYWPRPNGRDVDVFDRGTGQRRRPLDLDSDCEVVSGRTFYCNEGDRIVARDASGAKRLWFTASVKPAGGLRPLAVDDRRLYAFAHPPDDPYGRGALVAFDVARGTKLWTASEPLSLKSHQLIDGRLFVRTGGDGGAKLLSFDAATGEKRWSVPAKGATDGDRLAVANGLVIVAVAWLEEDGREPGRPWREHGEVWALDVATGRREWTHEAVGYKPSRVGATENVAIAAGRSTFEALDLATGRLVGRLEPLDVLSATPAAGVVPVLRANVVEGLRPADGTVAWRTPVEMAFNAHATTRDGVFYVNDTSGSLVAIEATTGGILWQIKKLSYESPAVAGARARPPPAGVTRGPRPCGPRCRRGSCTSPGRRSSSTLRAP
jgi:outer membrane protein assembly factor BamB